MCGIAGFYSIEKQNNFVTEKELIDMSAAIKHRGPDADGIYYKSNIGLCHRRLKIIDLSDDANQPFDSHSMRYTCVFNGEIYNYKDIAKDLNLEFKTNSDTEVVVEAFAEWGVTFINKLDGMFAIAIFDKQEQILYLFRDRLGIKPLFYYWDGINFAFASEIKALLKVKHIAKSTTINNIAINDFLHLGYIPEPETIYTNIRKFSSGQMGIVSANGYRMESYWNIESCIRRNVASDFPKTKLKLKKLIQDSIKSHIIGDVPIGSFLSGGIDSSLIAAIASQQVKYKLNTFSIGLQDLKMDESVFAKKIANFLGTEHHEYIISEKEAQDVILNIIDVYDEPYADSSAIPTMLLSKFAKQYVSMVFSGDGGDELFHGYGAYKWASRLNTLRYDKFKNIYSVILQNMPSNRSKRAAMMFKYKYKDRIKSHIHSQEQYFFSEQEIKKILNPEIRFPSNVNEDFTNYARKLTPAEAQSIFDLNYYLKDDLLVKVDRATMKYALEARVPLLDYKLVEYAVNIDPKLKMNGKELKYILKDILYDYIPETYFNRPKKGFSIPLAKWLRGELAFLINDFLNEKVVNKFNVVDFEHVRRLVFLFKSGNDYLYNRIWQLIILHQFLLKNEMMMKEFDDVLV